MWGQSSTIEVLNKYLSINIYLKKMKDQYNAVYREIGSEKSRDKGSYSFRGNRKFPDA